MIAKQVVQNKYWVVEDEGHQVATILAVDQGSRFVYVHGTVRESFPSINLLSKTYAIKFDKVAKKVQKDEAHICYGFPCSSKPFNVVWDVQRKLPVYSKSMYSRSYYCAGYYAIKFGSNWIGEYSPKNITLSRYSYSGPFKTKHEQQQFIKGQPNETC